ncbi:hypothetical protein [Hansschlegelia sp.]|uniref:hypothetical protein n=1 Tax=Hansschlegelia sp. TaxID=2041892 RepID=UPI002D0DBB6F|nr:hypothetical protein [Hansschlegelia sp.]HVI28168.1 hypothetical protein [Hansschlegelia sp.]
MIIRNTIAAGVAALALAAAPTLAMAQATATENNATGMGPNAGMEQGPSGSKAKPAQHKKTTKHQKKNMSGSASSKSGMKDGTPTSAGTADDQAKDLRGHSETPTTGK